MTPLLVACAAMAAGALVVFIVALLVVIDRGDR